jgi:hypothetical protein
MSAVWLVVLVILPVTAPFQTCSASDIFGARSSGRFPVVPVPVPTVALEDNAFALVPTVAPAARQLKLARCLVVDCRGIAESTDPFDLATALATAPVPSIAHNAFVILRL